MTQKCLLKIVTDDISEQEIPEYLVKCNTCNGLDTQRDCYVKVKSVIPKVYEKRFVLGTDREFGE